MIYQEINTKLGVCCIYGQNAKKLRQKETTFAESKLLI